MVPRKGIELAIDLRHGLGDARDALVVSHAAGDEGFAHALLEAVAARRPVVVNRYPVYARDLAPTGFRFVEIDGAVTDRAVTEVAALLDDPARVDRDTAHNHAVARAHFGLPTLERVLDGALADLGVKP